MKNKRNFIICIVIFLVLLVSVSLITIFSNKKVKYSSYEKYSTSITIDAITETKVYSVLIDTKCDGSSMAVNSTEVNKETYIIGDSLYYIDGNTIYNLEAPSSYMNIYDILKSFNHVNLNHKDSSYAYYETILDSKDINKILEALHFGKKATSKSLAKIVTLNGYIDEFNLTIDDIEGYKRININFKFKSLDSSFKIDTSKVYGSNSLGSVNRYKIVKTKENPYEVIK